MEGLKEPVFHVFENGREQSIASFEEHRAADAPEAAQILALPANVYSDYPRFAITSAANVLLLDALNTPLADQSYARQQMVDYLKKIPPGTRMAVFTMASRLRMIAGFTTDAGALEEAITRGKGRRQQSALLESPQEEDAEDDVAAGMSGADGGAMQQFLADTQSFQTDLRVRMTLDAMQELGRYLSMIPGRKNLIWFSGSFPLQIAPDASLEPSEASSPTKGLAAQGASMLNPFLAEREYSDEVKQTDDLLAAARVAVYPVDARGLMNLASVNASRSFAPGPGMGSADSRRSTGSIGGQSTAQRADSKFLQQTVAEYQTMQQIAEETGGEAFYDTNGLKEAVARAIENGSNYYTLGYVPNAQRWDGTFRTIEVRVEGGPHNLAYRRGYYADDPRKLSPDRPGAVSPIVAALERGAPPQSQIVFEARVLAASDPAARAVKAAAGPAGELAKELKGPVTRYLVDFSVDPHGLTWSGLPNGGAHAELEVSMVAWDGDGRRVNYTDHGFAADLNRDESAEVLKSGLPMHQEIDLPAGEIFLRVAVHDLRNGRIGATEIPLMVAKR
jgi:VWFA-related protein